MKIKKKATTPYRAEKFPHRKTSLSTPGRSLNRPAGPPEYLHKEYSLVIVPVMSWAGPPVGRTVEDLFRQDPSKPHDQSRIEAELVDTRIRG